MKGKPGTGRLLRFVVLSLISLGLAGYMTAVGSAADRNGCSATIDAPHYSSGAGGVIAKGRWTCAAPATIYLSGGVLGFRLWLCQSAPEQNEQWVTNNCVLKGTNSTNFVAAVANTTYTRYVPPESQPGAQGIGWWIACAQWQSNGYQGTSSTQTTFSIGWYGSGAAAAN